MERRRFTPTNRLYWNRPRYPVDHVGSAIALALGAAVVASIVEAIVHHVG